MSILALEILAVVLLLLLNGVFALAEMALVAARRTRLEQMAADGNAGAAVALTLSDNPSRFLSTVQVGITLIGILAGAFGGATLAGPLADVLARVPWLAASSDALSVVIVVLTITYFSLVVGELVPKRLALGQPERYAAALAPLMRRLSWLTGPLVTVLTASTSLVTRGLGVTDQDKPEITEDEVRMMIAQGTQVGVFEPLEEEIVDQLFRLGDRMVNSILTPRPDVVALDSQQTPEAIKQQVIAAHHARFPVYTGELDRIIGIVSAADLLAQLVDNQPLDLQAIMTPPLFVPESLPALDLVEKMRRHRTQLAVVIDEYGGVEGLVTTSDILEALVGDLPEPGQETDAEAVQREDGSWLLDGRFPIDQLLDLFPDVERPDDLPYYYQTIGGFVMNEVGGVPQVGERFDWRGLRFEVVDMDDRRVDRVLVSQSPT